jgi:hypothetical protein
MSKITAQREGQFRKFDLVSWNSFPDHKYGWEIVREEVPTIVKNNLEKAVRGRKNVTNQTGDPLTEMDA